jgi:hypothetical protein
MPYGGYGGMGGYGGYGNVYAANTGATSCGNGLIYTFYGCLPMSTRYQGYAELNGQPIAPMNVNGGWNGVPSGTFNTGYGGMNGGINGGLYFRTY